MTEFHLIIISAPRVIYDGPCVSLTVPAIDGQVGILAHHSPMVSVILPGPMTYQLPDGTRETVAVGSGFLEITSRDVLLLAETVERPEEIDENRAKHALEDAQEALRQQKSIREYKLNQATIAREINRLKVKQRNIV